MRIVLDAMGSDNYPDPEIQAVINAAEIFDDNFILVGDTSIIEPKFKSLSSKSIPVEFVHASEVIEMWDKPVESAQIKPNNSMAIGIKLLKEKRGDVFITAGNTGGAMFNALRNLGCLKGVQRPALPGIFPTKFGRCVVLDIGANVDCRPEFLLQFAIMGEIYSETVLGVTNPRIGLLANGEEPGKGNQLVKDTYPLLEKSGLNFIGNVEGKELFGGEVDVVLTDGFTGNILLKSSEAIAKLITGVLKEELMNSVQTKIGAFLAKPAFSKIKNLVDPGDVGAVPLLGIDGLVFIGHGRSNARALTNAIRNSREAVKIDLLIKIREAIQKRSI
ncbi:MAG TPA: phosphate acyltransferase PlsX [Anaerolineae bacterium]|nr:phosphate acyltransferase PlsX [Anaerolineae bacterium]